MADPMRLWRQAWLRGWKRGCQVHKGADGRGAASAWAIAVGRSNLTLREEQNVREELHSSHVGEQFGLFSRLGLLLDKRLLLLEKSKALPDFVR
jgi:hypothetical protein